MVTTASLPRSALEESYQWAVDIATEMFGADHVFEHTNDYGCAYSIGVRIGMYRKGWKLQYSVCLNPDAGTPEWNAEDGMWVDAPPPEGWQYRMERMNDKPDKVLVWTNILRAFRDEVTSA